MLEILMFTIWCSLAIYATWYFTVAKHYAPITSNDARILWKIHKKNIQCHAKRWREIRRKDKVVGFECECGYKHIQKRPIVASPPAISIQSQTSILNKPRNS